MARIRSVHPEFWRSEDIAALDWQTRLLFIGLWSYVDDNGVGRDVAKLICAELFPLEDDPRETLATVSRGLQALEDGGQIERYTVDGKPFLHIAAWAKWQKIDRPGKERYPLPTCENAEPRDTLATPSRVSRDTPSTGEGEKGRRGEGEKAPATAAAPPEAIHLCNVLADLIEANGSKRPKVTQTWLDSARLMLARDGRKREQAEALIRWCQADSFWRTNVLSMPKFRDKYDQLRLQARGEWERGRAAVSPDGEIDVDAVLGAERFVPPPPPDDLEPGTPAWQAWHREQRDQWKADRERRAREIVARRSA